MRVLKFLLQKEFRQIFRDPSIFRVLFIAPIIQLLILPLAANYQIKNIILEIPDHFQKDLVKDNKANLFVAANAINGIKAGLGSAYIQQIIQNYNQTVRMQWVQFPRFSPQPTIDLEYSDWYNPSMNYPFFMVPGILVMLIT